VVLAIRADPQQVPYAAYQGSIKVVLRLYSGSIQALLAAEEWFLLYS
jgi:hypothetical protein